MNHKFEEIKVENLRFSSFFIVFYSVMPKSVRPKVLISLRIRKSCNYNRALPIYH